MEDGKKRPSIRGSKTFGSFGSLRRSLPRLAAKSSASLSSGNSTDMSNSLLGGAHPGELVHRSFSPAQRRNDPNKVVSHLWEAGQLTYGVAQAVGKKDQDRFDVRMGRDNGSDCHYFGVFDGHGTSALAADVCVDRLYDEMAAAQRDLVEGDGGSDAASDGTTELEGYSASLSGAASSPEAMSMPDDEAIVRGYLRVDEMVQASRHSDPRSGACALTLFVQGESPGNLIDEDEGDSETQVKVAWAGDCRCFMITQSGDVDELTLDHRIDVNESEHRRIEEADHEPREGLLESDLWRREVERASRHKDSSNLRPHSFVGRRGLNGVPTGPQCVFSHTGGVSLQVTRSIGDAYAARSVIAEPDVVSLSIPKGQYVRFVLASDGIFEILSTLDVAKFVAKIPNAAKAAAKLSANAKQKRLYGGIAADDITCVVVDINPHMRKHFKASSVK